MVLLREFVLSQLAGVLLSLHHHGLIFMLAALVVEVTLLRVVPEVRLREVAVEDTHSMGGAGLALLNPR
jgi:hypothetical protein